MFENDFDLTFLSLSLLQYESLLGLNGIISKFRGTTSDGTPRDVSDSSPLLPVIF